MFAFKLHWYCCKKSLCHVLFSFDVCGSTLFSCSLVLYFLVLLWILKLLYFMGIRWSAQCNSFRLKRHNNFDLNLCHIVASLHPLCMLPKTSMVVAVVISPAFVSWRRRSSRPVRPRNMRQQYVISKFTCVFIPSNTFLVVMSASPVVSIVHRSSSP